MENWQDWRTGQPKHLDDLWTLTKDGREATCVLVAHPIGTEARLHVDGRLLGTKAFRDTSAMIDLTTQWRESFERVGWLAATEPNEST